MFSVVSMDLSLIKIYYQWKMKYSQQIAKHTQRIAKVAQFLFKFWMGVTTKTLLFLKTFILFIISFWWLWIILAIVFFFIFLIYMLITLLYYTQLMPIMAIKVNIEDHWLQNYVYSSDLWDIKGLMTNDDWGIKNFDQEFKKNLMKEIKSSLVTNEKTDNLVGALSQGLAQTLWQVIMGEAEKNNKYAQGLVASLTDCVKAFWEDNDEKKLYTCLYDKHWTKAISEQSVAARNAIMKQADINAYSLIQLKGIGLAYVKDYSNFCSAAWNVIKQAENGEKLDALDIQEINKYLNTTYMLGRDTLLGTINLGAWGNGKLGHSNPLFFLPELSVTAKLFETINQKQWQEFFKTSEMLNNNEHFFPTLNFIADIIHDNPFVSRLGESYFFPHPNSSGSFVTYKYKNSKDKNYSTELVFNPWKQLSEQELFKQNLFKTKEELEKSAKELTPEMKNLKTFYETSCSATNQENFVRLNFISTNGFALNRNGYLKTFWLGTQTQNAIFTGYKQTLNNQIKEYAKWTSANANPFTAYEFFNSTIGERLAFANKKDWTISERYAGYIKGVNHQKMLYFFNNFFFNNVNINSTDNLKTLSQLVNTDGKEKIAQLSEQLNYLGEVKEYDQIISQLHDMYILKGTVSGKYYVMDFSPLENIYKADPVYGHVTVMNPFPAYNATYDIVDSTITNQDFFKKINGASINKQTETVYNVPYVNIDITDVALELWYDWASPILVKYYLYGLDKNTEHYSNLLKKGATITLKHNGKAKTLPEYFIMQTKDVDGQNAFFKANPFLYSQNLSSKYDKVFYLGLWYEQISNDMQSWIDTFKATARAFGDDEQLRTKYKITSKADKVNQSEKVIKLNPKFKESVWVTSTTIKSKYEYEQFAGNYDPQPKKITVCINAPITVPKNMPVINMNLYQLIQNKEFNFIVPTTYSINKMYKVCMDLDNVYVKNETYLNYLKGNRTLNGDFKILGKANIVLSSLYLKDYVPENVSSLVGQKNIYTLRENALLRLLEKKAPKLLDAPNTSLKELRLPFCQLNLKPTVSQLITKGNSVVNMSSANPLTMNFKVKELGKKMNLNFSSLISTQAKLDNYVPTQSSIFKDPVGDTKLMEEYKNGTMLRDWTKNYRTKVADPLYAKYVKQANSISNIFNQSANSLSGWGMQERLWDVFGDAENNQYEISNFKFVCEDQNGLNHGVLIQKINTTIQDNKKLLNEGTYFGGTEKIELLNWTKDYSVDYGEFFYNPNMIYLSIPENTKSNEYNAFLKSQLFYQVSVWEPKVKTLRDVLLKYKGLERFIHLYAGLGRSSSFDEKGNKYFDYVDNLLWKTGWSQKNLIFAEGNKYILKKTEDMKILSLKQNTFMDNYLAIADKGVDKFLELIFGKVITKTEDKERLHKYFLSKTKNFSYSYIMENTIQPTYYNYFWSSASNSTKLGSSLPYFSATFKNGINKSAHPFYRLYYMQTAGDNSFTTWNNMQSTLSKVNTNHYFNGVWGKFFSTQNKNLMSYADIYSLYQKYSKVFGAEDIAGKKFAYVDGNTKKFNTTDLKDVTISPLSTLSYNGNNFYLFGDFIENYRQNGFSENRKYQYQYFGFKMREFFKNFDIDEQRIATANNFLQRGALFLKSLITVQSNQISWVFKNMFKLIMAQSNYGFDSIGAELEKVNANDANAESSNPNQVKKWTDLAMQARVKDAGEYAAGATAINDLLGLENGLNPYFDLQTTSLQEDSFFTKLYRGEALTAGEIQAFYEVYYDKNKVQEKILNYLQNVTTKERYDKIYALALDEAVKDEDREGVVLDNLNQILINKNRQNNNKLKEHYIPKMKDYSDNLIWWWDTSDKTKIKEEFEKIKKEYEEYISNKDFKIPEDFKTFAEWKGISADKIKTEYGAYLKNTKEQLEVKYLKQYSHKSFVTQYMELIANNLYINPITSLFKKLPEEQHIELTKGKSELAILEKVFNSFLVYSNLGNTVEDSPVFNVEQNPDKLIKPLVKLFNPSLSYVLQNLVDKSLVEVNIGVGNETVNMGSLSHNYSSFGESYGRVWLYNALTAIKSDAITTTFVKLMMNEKAVLNKPYRTALLIESFFVKEKNMYAILRSFLPNYMVLPPEIGAVGSFDTTDVDSLIDKRVEYVTEKLETAESKMQERVQTGKYSYQSFFRTRDTKLSGNSTSSQITLGNNQIVSMEGIDQFHSLPQYSEKDIINIAKENWSKLPNDAHLLQDFMRSNFYKKLLGISRYISPILYDESSKKFMYSETFHSSLWNLISANNEKKNDLTKALKTNSPASQLLASTVDKIAKTQLPSLASRGWISRYSELNDYGMVSQVKAGTVGNFQDNLPMFALLTSYWLEHIPFYQHHYLTALIKLKLQDQTTNPWTFFKVGTDKVLNVLSNSLEKKRYQSDVDNYINTNIRGRKGNLTAEEKANQGVKKFTASSDAKSLWRYYNSIIAYETGKAKLLQDAIDLWKEYNWTVDTINKDIFSVAYPSAKVEKDKKAGYENIIDATLGYYEKQANQLLMSLWGSYYYQRFNMSASYIAGVKDTFKNISLSFAIKDAVLSSLKDYSDDMMSFDAGLSKPISSNASMINTFKRSLSLELLRNDVKTRGWWFFNEEDQKNDPKALFEYLKSYHIQTGFYTYLLMLREILEPDVFERHDLAKAQTAGLWWSADKATEEDKAKTYLELGLISAYEYAILSNTTWKGWENVSYPDMSRAMSFESSATEYSAFRKEVENVVKKRFENIAKLIDGLIFIVTMDNNYQDVNVADAKIMSASNLWLKDYTELLGEPMVVNDLIMFLYGTDYIQAITQNSSQVNYINEIKQAIVKDGNTDIGTAALKVLKDETVDLEQPSVDNIKKANLKVLKNIPFMKWLAYYSLYSYDNLNINYSLYYQDYIQRNSEKTGYHYFNTTFANKKGAMSAFGSNMLDAGVGLIWDMATTAFTATLNLFGFEGASNTIAFADQMTEELSKPSWKTTSALWQDERHWIDLGNTISFSNMIADVWAMLFVQWWRFDQDFKGKDIKLLTEYIRLNDYIKYLYTSGGENDFLDGLRSAVNVNQITEKMIENSYTLGENLQTNNFALLNYILSNKKYQESHIYSWDNLSKWTELNKLNVIAFNYFSYEEDKDSILNATNVLNALQSGGFADGVDTSKIEWEWFVDGLDYIECKKGSQCERMINSIKQLPWWTAFNAYIQEQTENLKKTKDKNDKKTIEDTIKAMKDLLGSTIITKFDKELKGNSETLQIWDVVWFWDNEKASCKQRYSDETSKEFKNCLVDAIIKSKTWTTYGSLVWQCAWWTEVFRSWFNEGTRSYIYKGNGNNKTATYSGVKNYSVSGHYVTEGSILGSMNATINGIHYQGKLNDKLSFCPVKPYDLKALKGNMIFSTTSSWWSAWHTWYISWVRNCDAKKCDLITLQTNYKSEARCWEKTNIYNNYPCPNKLNVRYGIYPSTKVTVNYVDLDKPFKPAMIQQTFWVVNNDTIYKFCADYENNIKKFQ